MNFRTCKRGYFNTNSITYKHDIRERSLFRNDVNFRAALRLLFAHKTMLRARKRFVKAVAARRGNIYANRSEGQPTAKLKPSINGCTRARIEVPVRLGES